MNRTRPGHIPARKKDPVPVPVSETDAPDLLDALREILATEALHAVNVEFPPYPSAPR